MRIRDIILVVVAYLAGLWATLGVLVLLKATERGGLVFVVGAILGVIAGAWGYYRHGSSRPAASAKMVTGALMAGLCLAHGLTLETWLGWPDRLTLAIDMLGTVVFPFVLFGAFAKGFARKGPGNLA